MINTVFQQWIYLILSFFSILIPYLLSACSNEQKVDLNQLCYFVPFQCILSLFIKRKVCLLHITHWLIITVWQHTTISFYYFFAVQLKWYGLVFWSLAYLVLKKSLLPVCQWTLEILRSIGFDDSDDNRWEDSCEVLGPLSRVFLHQLHLTFPCIMKLFCTLFLWCAHCVHKAVVLLLCTKLHVKYVMVKFCLLLAVQLIWMPGISQLAHNLQIVSITPP